jgi:hypothetical protein
MIDGGRDVVWSDDGEMGQTLYQISTMHQIFEQSRRLAKLKEQ